MRTRIRSIGPAALVTAAFIGPGTVTTCSLAGAGYGYALLWALLFSVIATVVLQEMAARLGIVARKDLGEALHAQFPRGIGRVLSVLLVVSAIGIGNAAYETGNIMGGVLGLEALVGELPLFGQQGIASRIWGPLTGILAFVLLWFGSYRRVEKILVAMVIVMSILFLTTMVLVAPSPVEILRGMFIPGIPAGSILMVTGLVGTTVVPYNLFLHAATVRERWKDASGLPEARLDTRVSILLGGLVSISIVITAAAAFHGTGKEIRDASDLAVQLEPVLGNWARGFVAIGLFAAGLTSAITAPLAASYAIGGLLGWPRELKSTRYRSVWIIILATGIVLSALGLKPMAVILFAQATNGILLPVIAAYLLWVMNDRRLLGEHRNKQWMNLLGIMVVIITIILGIRSLFSVISTI